MRGFGGGLAALACASPARAAGSLPTNGQPIRTSSYAIDFFQGPVLDSVRVTSLAGAYAPIAEGVEGMRVNTAAPAVRSLYSSRSTDYDIALSFTNPSATTDFDNNGTPGFTYDKFSFATVGGLIQFGKWGIGLVVSSQRYTVGQPSTATSPEQTLSVELSKGNVQVARSFSDRQITVGLGARLARLVMSVEGAATTTEDTAQTSELVSINGSAFEAGLLWAPHELPLRAALSVRSRVRSIVESTSRSQPNPEGDLLVEGRYLPTSIVLPWEAEVGVAYQLGPRPLNAPWPLSREEYAALPRKKVLLTSSLLVSGPVSNAIGVESFLAQRVERSGQRATLTPRVGAEVEPIEGWLQVRAGSYLEPSRYAGKSSRLHGTLGLEARLFPWTIFGLLDKGTWWRGSAFVDASNRYLGWGLSVGLWH